jgi:hypothetical protein
MVRTRWATLAVAVGLGTLAGCSTSRPFGSRLHGDPKPAYPDAGVPVTEGPIITEGPAPYAPAPYAPVPPPGMILSAPPAVPPVVAPATPVPPTAPPPREVPQPAPTGRTTKGTT